MNLTLTVIKWGGEEAKVGRERIGMDLVLGRNAYEGQCRFLFNKEQRIV